MKYFQKFKAFGRGFKGIYLNIEEAETDKYLLTKYEFLNFPYYGRSNVPTFAFILRG